MASERDEPLLGLATTRELLEEVAVRMEITQNSTNGRRIGVLCREAMENLAPSILDYRTVGNEPRAEQTAGEVNDEHS